MLFETYGIMVVYQEQVMQTAQTWVIMRTLVLK
jgi:DNA polymerase III alpha subunit